MNTDLQTPFLHQELTAQIIGCFYAVYNSLGYGFLESVYEAALAHEIQLAGLEVELQVPIDVHYRGAVVGSFRADMVVSQKVLVELKAARALDPQFEAQVLNYLRATNIEVALLLNFGPRPEIKRLLFDNGRKLLSVSSV